MDKRFKYVVTFETEANKNYNPQDAAKLIQGEFNNLESAPTILDVKSRVIKVSNISTGETYINAE